MRGRQGEAAYEEVDNGDDPTLEAEWRVSDWLDAATIREAISWREVGVDNNQTG